MLTPWGESLDKDNVLKEYPRPQMKRDSYLNLNGLWDYAITPAGQAPLKYDGRILVPFSPESGLSGAERGPKATEHLWYHLETELPEGFNRGRVLLHFGAVDQTATLWVNGTEILTHTGGFTPFSADITAALGDSGRLDIRLRVIDTTDEDCQTRGKQRIKRGGIWHTPQSGVWQAVWAESVPEKFIRGLRLIPRYDEQKIEIWVAGEGEVNAVIDGREHSFPAGTKAVLELEELHPWSPEDPYLYSLSLTLGEDRVESYFAMRKFSVEPDADGQRRLCLNGRPYFHNGVLDQGLWSDGLMTPPSDEAMIFDIKTAKAMGFNMLRKHAKIEPLRWYYHCDRLGMLVWQDMPSGGSAYRSSVISSPLIPRRDSSYAAFGRKSEESRSQYYAELREMINALINCPCIAMWVPFNEGWGQFDAEKVCQRIYEMDKTRTVDHASGWYDQGAGDVKSWHVYRKKYDFEPDDLNRAVVLSAFGGYIHRIDGHCYGEKEFGYKKFDSHNSYVFALRSLYAEQIMPAWHEGLSAAVYTQLTDAEDELSGLITCDRKVTKIAPEMMKGIVKVR